MLAKKQPMAVPLSPIQYEQFVRPVPGLTATDLFEHERARAINLGFMTAEEADPFRDKIGDKFPLLVPRRPQINSRDDLDELMKLVVQGGTTGVNYLDPALLCDLVEEPEGPSLLVGVEDGHARRNQMPIDSQEKVEEEGRHPFNTWRGIWFAICFPHVLAHHHLDLVGSRYDSVFVPNLGFSCDEPALCVRPMVLAYPKCGAPSCGSVLEI